MNGESQLYQGGKGDFLSSSLFWSGEKERTDKETRGILVSSFGVESDKKSKPNESVE